MTLPSTIRRTELSPNYPVFEIHHPTARARVALYGAELLEWIPTDRAPVLYLSPQAVFREGTSIRGGVPVCWPWFGPHESDAGLPAHGFVRIRFWNLVEASEDKTGVRLKFSLQDDAETRRLWPHAFRLMLDLQIGAELSVSLQMENTGDAPFTITGALHTYLAVGDIRRTTIEGLDGAEYLDTVGPRQVRRQTGNIAFDREVDRIYHASTEVRVKDAALGRVLAVQGTGSQCTVVWNPWIAKAASLADIPDEDYLRFVCVETANAWQDCITLAPGGTHQLASTVRVG